MTAPRTWAEGIQAVHHEAAGVCSMQIVQPSDQRNVFTDALDGDVEAIRLAKAVLHANEGIRAAAGTRHAKLCASCPRPLRLGRFAFAIVQPHCDDPSNIMALAVCRRCATARPDVERKARQALTRIWPDLRPIAVHPEAGRA